MPGELTNCKTKVIVIAAAGLKFRWDVTFLLDRLGVKYTLCESLYSGLGELARYTEPNRDVLIIATLKELSREKMRFFDICRNRGNIKCCCLVRKPLATQTREAINAVKDCACIAGSIEDIEDTIKQTFAGQERKSDGERSESKTEKSVFAGGVTLSRAELDALLGVELDADV